jgi:hypothetical protein
MEILYICDNILDGAGTCRAGYDGWRCDTNVDECRSYPCSNGATCIDAAAAYSCACVSGFVGVECAVDFDECGLTPCANGAACDESTSSARIAPSFFHCTCFAGANCTVDIDECASKPCWNGATCSESATGRVEVVPGAYHCSCAPGFAEGWCSYQPRPIAFDTLMLFGLRFPYNSRITISRVIERT